VWLEVNPFVWLAARVRQLAALAWAVVGGGVLLWLVCWVAWPARWPSVPNFFIKPRRAGFRFARGGRRS
jgi:hypothetical protein